MKYILHEWLHNKGFNAKQSEVKRKIFIFSCLQKKKKYLVYSTIHYERNVDIDQTSSSLELVLVVIFQTLQITFIGVERVIVSEITMWQ